MGYDARRRLRAAVADRYPVFTTADARADGVGGDELKRMVASREIQRLHQGTYCFAGTVLDETEALRAAVRACGPNAVAAARSAARLLGIPGVEQPPLPEVCVPYLRMHRPTNVVVHRSRELEPCDIAEVDGIPTTTVARTIVDLCRCSTEAEILRIVDSVICAKLVHRKWLHRRATSLQAGRRGVARLAVLTGPGGEADFRSYLERKAARDWRARGIPTGEWNVPLYDDAGLIGLADCHWGWRPLTVELEGMRFHTTPAQRKKDAERFTRQVLAGHRPLRFTYQDIIERPEWCAEQIRRGLAR